MKSLLIATMLFSLLTSPLSAMAAQDEGQRQMMLRTAAAKQKLQQAQAARGLEQKGMMAEHMKMMQEIMEKVTSMKPKAGMSMQEHEEWMGEHQKIMQQVMDQMMGEHHLMMQACTPSAK
jgi:hypothetical protein